MQELLFLSAYIRLWASSPQGSLLGPRQPCPSQLSHLPPSTCILEAIMGIALPAASLGPAVPQVGIHVGLHQPCGFSRAGPVQPGTLLCSHPSCWFINSDARKCFQNWTYTTLSSFFKVTVFLLNSRRIPAPSFCPSKEIWSTLSAFVLGPHHPVSCQKLALPNGPLALPYLEIFLLPRSTGPLWESDITFDLYLIQNSWSQYLRCWHNSKVSFLVLP